MTMQQDCSLVITQKVVYAMVINSGKAKYKVLVDSIILLGRPGKASLRNDI